MSYTIMLIKNHIFVSSCHHVMLHMHFNSIVQWMCSECVGIKAFAVVLGLDLQCSWNWKTSRWMNKCMQICRSGWMYKWTGHVVTLSCIMRIVWYDVNKIKWLHAHDSPWNSITEQYHLFDGHGTVSSLWEVISDTLVMKVHNFFHEKARSAIESFHPLLASSQGTLHRSPQACLSFALVLLPISLCSQLFDDPRVTTWHIPLSSCDV